VDEIRARVLISGRVQGVFFRQSAATAARARDLAGSVRNLPDGRVEAVFQGPRPDVEASIEWCRTGPPSAKVFDIQVEFEPLSDAPRPFVIAG